MGDERLKQEKWEKLLPVPFKSAMAHHGYNKETYLPEGDNTLLWSNNTTLDHEEIIVNFTIVREASHGSNGLLSQIILS